MMEVDMKMHQVALFLRNLLKECLLKNEHFNLSNLFKFRKYQ